MTQEKYRVAPGPEAFLAPAAAIMGVTLPSGGGAMVEGEAASEAAAIDLAARKLAEAKAPAVCPGPLLLWQWTEDGGKPAAVKKLAEACGALILPMPDYSAKRINPAAWISPNHPNVTVIHNDIDVCLFAGMHSHYANMALRLIRGGTGCYTIALSDYAVSDEAMISIGDIDVKKINLITEKIKSLKGKS